MPEDMIYGHLNNEWNRTCKVVLGGEVGELKEFENWLWSLSSQG